MTLIGEATRNADIAVTERNTRKHRASVHDSQPLTKPLSIAVDHHSSHRTPSCFTWPLSAL
jgi:hypothetical protein